jgi:peptidoglycan/LPS O-acetylase OafA/YrhL
VNTGLRSDIQGLRGLAIVVVVLDHATGWPTGGFLGVDSFFVISGFIIARGLLRERERSGRISIRGFALRRLRRLGPTSLLAVIVTLTAGIVILGAGRAKDLLLDGVTSLLGVANWRFASAGTGYFDQGAPPSPFQHFWSLGVEEQFYLVLPVLLLLLLPRRTGRRPVVAVVVLSVLAMGSLAAALATAQTAPDASYFVTTTRAWQLLFGVLLAIVSTRSIRVPGHVAQGVAMAGIAMLVGSVVLGTESFGVPAPLGLLPTCGTAMIIWAGTVAESTLVGRALSFPPLVWIGDVSFSLYVWHWPILVLVPMVVPAPPALLIALAVVLAAVSHALVEQPLRAPAQSTRSDAVLRRRGLAGIGALLVANVLIWGVAIERGTPPPIPAGYTPAALTATDDSDDDEQEAPAIAERAELIRAGLEASTWSDELRPTKAQITDTAFGPGLVTAPEWSSMLGCGVVEKGRSVADCTFGNPDRPTVMLVGDSTGAFLSPALISVAEQAGTPWNVVNATSFGCPYTALDIEHIKGSHCETARSRSADWIRTVEPEVLLVTNVGGPLSGADGPLTPAEQAKGVEDALDAVRDVVGTAAIVPANPAGPDLRSCIASVRGPASCVTSAGRYGATDAAARAAAEEHGTLYVDTRDVWCVSGSCPAQIGDDVVRYDIVHALPNAAVAAGPALRAVLERGHVFDALEPADGAGADSATGS